MNKVFINKETDMVEQILEVKEGEIISDDYFPNCYAVEDAEEKINAYNLRYNKETKEFEVVEGVPAKDEVIVIKSDSNEDIEKLKKENEELRKENDDVKERLEKLESLVNQAVLNVR